MGDFTSQSPAAEPPVIITRQLQWCRSQWAW
jgi:hypothetical protein